jgi:hypothetical protein
MAMAQEMKKSGVINNFQDLMDYTYEGQYAEQYMLGGGTPRAFKQGGDGDLMSVPAKGIGRMLDQNLDLKKADDPYLTTKTNYFNPIYGKTAVNWLNMEADLWKLLRKTTYQALGGSVRIITTEATNFHGQLETAASLGDTDIPTLQKVNYTDPAVMYNYWDASLLAKLKHNWEDTPGMSAEDFFKNYFAMQHPLNINLWLGQDTDTLAAGGGNFDNYIESIDRVCSDGAESALLSAPTDNDIHGFDRSANEAEAYNDLNGGVLRNLTLDLIDDMVADTKLFSERRNYIMITSEEQLNKIESLEDVKRRYATTDKWKIDAVNGVNTRRGEVAGFAVSEYIAAGIPIPIFTSQHVHAESGGSGNIYLLDMDHIEVRVALPTVYISTEQGHFPLLDSMFFKYMYLTVAQLIADKYSCHGAIKYLN